jgi:hypothetical protein
VSSVVSEALVCARSRSSEAELHVNCGTPSDSRVPERPPGGITAASIPPVATVDSGAAGKGGGSRRRHPLAVCSAFGSRNLLGLLATYLRGKRRRERHLGDGLLHGVGPRS